MNSKQFTDIIFQAARKKRDEQKIKFITNSAIGYLEAALTLARKKQKTKKLELEMSQFASSIQILEKIQNKYLDLMKKNPRKKNMYVKEFYGRVSSVFKKLKFEEVEKLLK